MVSKIYGSAVVEEIYLCVVSVCMKTQQPALLITLASINNPTFVIKAANSKVSATLDSSSWNGTLISE